MVRTGRHSALPVVELRLQEGEMHLHEGLVGGGDVAVLGAEGVADLIADAVQADHVRDQTVRGEFHIVSDAGAAFGHVIGVLDKVWSAERNGESRPGCKCGDHERRDRVF